MTKNILYFIIVIFVLIQCKPEKSVSIDQLNGVYEVNKDSLKALFTETNDNPVAKTLMDLALNATDINFKIENDSISGMITLMGFDQKINSRLYIRNDSIYYKGEDEEFFLNPTESGFSVVLLDNKVNLNRITGSKSDEISKKIDQAKLITVE